MHPLRDDLAAELHRPAVLEQGLLDAAPGTVARLEDEHVGAGVHQVPPSRQTREAGPHHDHVTHGARAYLTL